MRQYQVPQFITIEDKVFGPFTIKQFLYIGSGALFIVGARMFLHTYLFFPLAGLIGGVAAAFAFLKINDQPFPTVFKNWVSFTLRPRLYIWKQSPLEKKAAPKAEQSTIQPLIKNIPKISESKLTDLAWSLDIKSKRE